MTVIEQLQQMTDNNYNPKKLQAELEALFKKPENFKIYQEAIKHNCYLNTESGAGLNNNVNPQVEQDVKTHLKQLVLTITDRYEPDKLLHFELVIEEPFKSREPLRYVKAIVKKEPKGISLDDKILNIRCDIQENNQRLDHRQIIDFITQTFGF